MSIKELEYKREVAWYSMDDAQKDAAHSFSKGYIDFLNNCKIERECVTEIRAMAEKNGFVQSFLTIFFLFKQKTPVFSAKTECFRLFIMFFYVRSVFLTPPHI